MSGNGSSGAGRLNYEMPVVTVMPGHKEHSTFVDLQKTLSQLGFDSGSALLRLSFKNSGTPLEEAMAQISQYFKSADPVASGAHAESSVQVSSIPDPEKAAPEALSTVAGETIRPEEPEPMDVDTPSTETTSQTPVPSAAVTAEKPENQPPTSSQPGPSSPVPPVQPLQTTPFARNIQVFTAPSSSTPQAARQMFNEADYVPTIEHAKAHQAALNQRTKNSRLLSDKELEEQATARQEKLDATAEKGGIVRVRLPDGAIIQANIYKADDAATVYDVVASCLEHKYEPFQLQYRGPVGRPVKMDRDNKRVFRDLGFSASELLTFLWDETASAEARRARNLLSAEWQTKAQALRVEEPLAANEPSQGQGKELGKAEGKRKVEMSASEKESKIKNLLKGSLFQKSKK